MELNRLEHEDLNRDQQSRNYWGILDLDAIGSGTTSLSSPRAGEAGSPGSKKDASASKVNQKIWKRAQWKDPGEMTEEEKQDM